MKKSKDSARVKRLLESLAAAQPNPDIEVSATVIQERISGFRSVVHRLYGEWEDDQPQMSDQNPHMAASLFVRAILGSLIIALETEEPQRRLLLVLNALVDLPALSYFAYQDELDLAERQLRRMATAAAATNRYIKSQKLSRLRQAREMWEKYRPQCKGDLSADEKVAEVLGYSDRTIANLRRSGWKLD